MGVAALKMSSPGATMSGLKRPSAVGPRLEKVTTLVAERRLPDATEQLLLLLHVVWFAQHISDTFITDAQWQQRPTQVSELLQHGSLMTGLRPQKAPSLTKGCIERNKLSLC
jgi:hypothetical protein